MHKADKDGETMSNNQHTRNRPAMVRVAQAVDELGFSTATFYRMVKKGHFTIVKRGFFSYVPTSEIDKFLDPNDKQMVG